MSKPKLIIDKGQTFTLKFVLKDGNGTVMDLTGYGAHLQVGPGPSPAVDLSTTTTPTNITVNNVGEVSIHVSKTITRTYTEGSYPLELEMTEPGGDNYVVLDNFSVVSSVINDQTIEYVIGNIIIKKGLIE